ncbi:MULTISPECIES: CsiV family protein [unclassified Pseudomonas]|jgi:hypothetical protein|uniref:CsiV family protein n=1 Tax=unclassified Pseudomonas TaxID=196821 RepID=UPI000BA4DEE6|nr:MULTISPECIES: CsiV family protein [unclassified Pseudomonas]MCU1724909.1 peptidoglycan binding protein CsiV [Pseudomonas sp. 5P_5.1_Bac1]MCU1732768.1 peptidoglycan binding protein CsiV [Pseudomonas sp. 20P_3.2_Bac4]MCU1745075.1 peptidoglycan binding protein CsiV [Pseudomonas sp. 20P_3.2_Bac5]
MRAIRNLSLLLALCSPAAFADTQYLIEMILVRQNAVPAVTSQFAPENWSDGAKPVADYDIRQPLLTEQAERLAADSQYSVLLHKAWQQNVGAEGSKIAFSDGQEQFGHFPIEGNLSVSEGRFIGVEATLWVNQFDANGGVLQSEQFKQSNSNVKNAELTYLDGGHLALVLKIRKAGTPANAAPDPALMEQ